MADRQPDIHFVICKVCGQNKRRIRNGKYGPEQRTPRWLGEDGKLWNGRTCGKCHIQRTAVNIYNKRDAEND